MDLMKIPATDIVLDDDISSFQKYPLKTGLDVLKFRRFIKD